MSDVVIKVENLWKEYRLGTISHNTMAKDLQSWWARLRGKEDPNSCLDSSSATGFLPGADRFWALRDVSFDIHQGDVLGIIGRNGAGKSTLLKILSRVTTPTKGRVTFKGRIASLLEVGTGFHPELTGRENVFLNGSILGMRKEEIRRKFDEIVAFAEIEKFIDTPVKRYSSGMYVRLAFGVAAHLEPEILIVDEVLAVGDAQFQAKCLGKMEEVGKEGRTVLFVSHNMNAISRLCQKALLLSEGSIFCQGITKVVIPSYLNLGGSNSNSEAVFLEDKNKVYQLLGADLHFADGGKVDRPVNVDEPISVNLHYKLSIPLPGGYACLIIKNQNGENVLFSDNRDTSGSVSFENSGMISAQIQIPAPLLVPGKYSITASLARPPLGTIDGREDILTFEVEDTAGFRTNRTGYIFAPLLWRSITQ